MGLRRLDHAPADVTSRARSRKARRHGPGPSATVERAPRRTTFAPCRPTRRAARPTGRNVRLDTLVRLRWLAVIGQTTAVLVVYFGLDFELPIWACLAVIALVGLAQHRAARALPA